MNEIQHLFLPRHQHHIDLERSILEALERREYHNAFGLADRRCRIFPRPDGRIHLLRAEALHHLGLKVMALESVFAVRDLDPDNVAAARRMMLWGGGEAQHEAAIAVARHDTDIGLIKSALGLLEASGQDCFARLVVRDEEVSGWVTWLKTADAQVVLTTSEITRSVALAGQPRHQLASDERAASDFRIARPSCGEIQSLRVICAGRMVLDDPLPPNRPPPDLKPALQPKNEGRLNSARRPLTVVVPVYRDAVATAVCLASLDIAMKVTKNCRVILVDDASPEPAIKDLLQGYAQNENFDLLVNERNLGFVGAVNRGLSAIPDGDVVLLNADTLVPKEALNRLRSVVAANPRIGTATPLSNNGEFTSFPVPNRPNPVADLNAVLALDSVAALANKDIVVDIPNGIGFCLYITRECLDAVSELSLDFHRGYLEDVDFCLRATEAGLRNVCVPSVFVGHEGSRSFRQDKRSLVVRNLRVLEQRYPRYVAECAAFLAADPLRGSRVAIERAILPYAIKQAFGLVLCGRGAIREIAFARAKQLAASGRRCWVISFESEGARSYATVLDPAGQVPQSLDFDLDVKDQRNALFALLAGTTSGLEIADPRSLPGAVLTFIRERSLPYSILITDGSLAANSASKWGMRANWRSFAKGARAILALDPRGAEFAHHVLDVDVRNEFKTRSGSVKPRKGATPTLGVLALRSDAEEYQFLRALVATMEGQYDFRIVVLGTTLDDISLMRSANVLVSGKLSEEDTEALVEGYGITKLAIDIGSPLFGHPLKIGLEATRLPRALVDWSGVAKTRKSDLKLAPDLPASRQAALIAQWAAR